MRVRPLFGEVGPDFAFAFASVIRIKLVADPIAVFTGDHLRFWRAVVGNFEFAVFKEEIALVDEMVRIQHAAAFSEPI